jgi:hypothetical protein
MDFGESFGVFSPGDGGGAEKLESWKAGKLEFKNPGRQAGSQQRGLHSLKL